MDKEENKLSALLKSSKFEELKLKLDNISRRSPVLKGMDGMVELDPKNKQHQEWYEIDKYRNE